MEATRSEATQREARERHPAAGGNGESLGDGHALIGARSAQVQAAGARGRNERVLVVEDDPDVRDVVCRLLRREHYDVHEATSVRAAEAALAAHPDICLAIVDLTLHDGDGIDLVKKLSFVADIAVVILSGKGDSTDRIVGLEVGADDYVPKPFHGRELVARVKRHVARMRQIRDAARSQGAVPGERFGPWRIDEGRRCVVDERGGRAPLSEAEFRTLVCLLRQRGQVLTRDALYNAVVGPGSRDPLDRRIDVYVAALRKKLRLRTEAQIRTVHRVGYIID